MTADPQEDRFAVLLAGTADTAVLDWFTGLTRPPAAVTGAVADRRDAMIAALRRATGAAGPTTALPTVVSGHRDFARQERIWSRKFAFDRRVGSFGRITDQTRGGCPALGSAVEWDTTDDVHRACWAGLADDQRAREILQTSSGPGISRHHWGTDLDLWSTSPADFVDGGPLAGEYSWLSRHAATFGFVQPFTARSAAGRLGHLEERWHWSYRPAAQAMLEWADARRGIVDTRLRALWRGRPQYAFLRAHWAEFVFHVDQARRS